MEKICTVYLDLPFPERFEQEVEWWKHKWKDTVNSLSLDQALVEADPSFYPNIHTAFQILLTMPVTTDIVERTFSCLGRLKTWLRSTMHEDRLYSLAMMNIHKDICIDEMEVLREWNHQGPHRLYLTLNY